MAFNEELAERVRELLDRPGMEEKRMFGGLAWLANGNMAVAVLSKERGLMVRVSLDDYDVLLTEPGAGEMVMSGRVTRGWITVDESACAEPEQLETWVMRGLDYALTLPPK